MNKLRLLSFSDKKFISERAHNGIGKIKFCRNIPDCSHSYRFIDLVVVPRGTSIGIHRHSFDNTEIYIFINGEGNMYLDGESFAIKPGEVVINQPGGTHGFTNTGLSDVKIIVIEIEVKQMISTGGDICLA